MNQFKKAYIEITNTCNLSCDFCPKTKRKSLFMNKGQFIHIIKEVSPYTKFVYFHLMGEPLLHPLLGEFLSICQYNNLKAIITSNGTLLKNTEDVLLTSKALHKMNISLHSFDKNQNNYSLCEYLTCIVDFIKKASNSTICVLRLWNIDTENTEKSHSQNKDTLHLIKKLLGVEIDIGFELSKCKSIKLMPNIYIEKANKFDWPDINSKVLSDKVFCHGLRDQFGVLSDGSVVPCCLDKDGNINLGNIFKTSLSEILSSKRAKRIYDGFSQRKPSEELCKRCDYAHQNF